MVLSRFLTSRGYFHRGRLRAGVAAPHPVSEITVRQSFSKNQGCGAATYEPERLAVEISSVHTRKMRVIFEIVRLLEILN